MNKRKLGKRCDWCGRDARVCFNRGCLDGEERVRLTAYVQQHGTRWRSKLRREWTAGGSALRQLRNIAGPTGIDHVKPPT